MPSLSTITGHPLFNLGAFLALRQVTKGLPLDDPVYLWGLRALYITTQLIILGLNYYLIWKVNKKNDTTPLRYVEAAQQKWDGTEEPETLVSTTYKDYDIAEIKKAMRQTLPQILLLGFMHLKFKYVQPLIIQSIMAFKAFFTTKEARIHFWGESASSGPLRRPFRVETPFNIGAASKQPKTDKASIKRAEKAMKAE